MKHEVLIIEDSFDLPDGKTALSVNFSSLETRMKYRELDFETVKNRFREKELRIVCTDFEFNTSLIDIDVASSLAEFKLIFLMVEKTSKTEKIRKFDKVYVDLKNE